MKIHSNTKKAQDIPAFPFEISSDLPYEVLAAAVTLLGFFRTEFALACEGAKRKVEQGHHLTPYAYCFDAYDRLVVNFGYFKVAQFKSGVRTERIGHFIAYKAYASFVNDDVNIVNDRGACVTGEFASPTMLRAFAMARQAPGLIGFREGGVSYSIEAMPGNMGPDLDLIERVFAELSIVKEFMDVPGDFDELRDNLVTFEDPNADPQDLYYGILAIRMLSSLIVTASLHAELNAHKRKVVKELSYLERAAEASAIWWEAFGSIERVDFYAMKASFMSEMNTAKSKSQRKAERKEKVRRALA